MSDIDWNTRINAEWELMSTTEVARMCTRFTITEWNRVSHPWQSAAWTCCWLTGWTNMAGLPNRPMDLSKLMPIVSMPNSIWEFTPSTADRGLREAVSWCGQLYVVQPVNTNKTLTVQNVVRHKRDTYRDYWCYNSLPTKSMQRGAARWTVLMAWPHAKMLP